MHILTRVLPAVIALLGILWASDQFADSLDKRNPHSDPKRAVWADENVPDGVRAILARSCSDCHSNVVRWPYISRLPLVAGIFEEDVARARKQMNLSEWTMALQGNPEEFDGMLNGICEETKLKNMPPMRYVVMHPGSRIATRDSEILCQWVTSATNVRIKKGS